MLQTEAVDDVKSTINSTASKMLCENGEDSDFDPLFAENDPEAEG